MLVPPVVQKSQQVLAHFGINWFARPSGYLQVARDAVQLRIGLATQADPRPIGHLVPVGRDGQVGEFGVELQPRETTSADLNVIGCTVDEALTRAERFLDESLLGDQRVLRLIHGYGTGQLKRALAGFLQQHPLVARFATAPPNQGGGGVTVGELKD